MLGRKRLVEQMAAQLVKTNDELLKQNKKFADAMLAMSEEQLDRMKIEKQTEQDAPSNPFRFSPRVDRLPDQSMPDYAEIPVRSDPDVG